MSLPLSFTPDTHRIPNAVARHFAADGLWDGINHVDPEPPTDTPADPAPGGEPLGESGLAALQAERQRAGDLDKKYKALERQFKQFEGIDPGRYKEAMDALNKQSEYEQQQAKWKAETEAQYKQKYEPQLQQQQQLVAETQQQLQDYKRDVLLERAYIDADGISRKFKYAKGDMQGRVRLSEAGELEVLDANGDPAYVADSGKSRPMSISELIDELAQQDLAFADNFKGNDSPGFALRGDGSYNPADPRMANLSAAEKLNLMRQGKRR